MGTIEGRLQGVFTHGVKKFYIYDSATDRQVRCEFGDRVPLKKVLEAYESRVAVSGFIKVRKKTGQRLSIQAHDLRQFRDDSELASTDEILRAWREQ